MAELAGEGEWARKEAIAVALVDFMEGWVVKELCLHLRTIAEGVYGETPEDRLVGALLVAPTPQTRPEFPPTLRQHGFLNTTTYIQ